MLWYRAKLHRLLLSDLICHCCRVLTSHIMQLLHLQNEIQTINKGSTSRNMRSHSAIYRVGRDFFTGLQKHVSVTTGVLLCSLMFSAAHRMSRRHRTRVTTHGGPGGLARCRARFHNLARLRFLSVDSHRFLSVDPRRFPSLLRC